MILGLLFLATVVAAAAIALVLSQRGHLLYLRTLLNEKREHERRVERAEAGLPELAPQITKPDPCPAGVDVRIRQAIEKWEGDVTRQAKWQDVAGWKRDGKSWDWIAQELEADTE